MFFPPSCFSFIWSFFFLFLFPFSFPFILISLFSFPRSLQVSLYFRLLPSLFPLPLFTISYFLSCTCFVYSLYILQFSTPPCSLFCSFLLSFQLSGQVLRNLTLHSIKDRRCTSVPRHFLFNCRSQEVTRVYKQNR